MTSAIEQKDLSVIIVNYNTGKLLLECVSTIYQETKGCDFEIIVVDNASSDDSVDLVIRQFDKVRVIRNKTNLGFSAANNIGVSKAIGEFVILLNPDTRIVDEALNKLLRFIGENQDSVGAIGPKLVDEKHVLQRDQGYRFPGIFTTFSQYFFLGHIFGLPGIYMNRDIRRARDVDWLSGACLCCSRKLYEDIGGMDESYFLYAEDMEFCYKLKKAGHRVIFFPDAAVVHISKQSVSKQEESIVKLQIESLKRFYRSYHNGFSYFMFKSMIFLGFLLRLFVFRTIYLFDSSLKVRNRINDLKLLLRHIYA